MTCPLARPPRGPAHCRPVTTSVQLSGIEVRHLQAFQAVVEEGSIRGAADRLGYAQASVSAQIAALERSVGSRLLDRAAGRPVSLTAAGDAFYGAAVAAIARLRTGAQEAAAVHDGAAPLLRMGTFPSAAARLLPGLLARLSERWPYARVTLFESSRTEDLEAALEAGDLDLSFVVLPLGRPALEIVSLHEDPFCVLAARNGPLGSRTEPMTIEDLARHPLIISDTCAHLTHLQARMRLRGHEPTVFLHTDDDGLVHNLVSDGRGIAVVASLQVDPHRADLTTVPVADVLPPRIVALAWSRERPLTTVAEAVIGWAVGG
jgi:DNA-binding transcriptional LysR family regulator